MEKRKTKSRKIGIDLDNDVHAHYTQLAVYNRMSISRVYNAVLRHSMDKREEFIIAIRNKPENAPPGEIIK